MKAQANWNGLSEIELCYFAALIDGLRLINEKAEHRKINHVSIDSTALIDYVQEKGQQILAAVHSDPKAEQARVVRLDRKGRFGRGGIPADVVRAMSDEYRRTNSLSATGRAFGRTRQAMWEILRRRIELNHPILQEGVFYNGRKFTPAKDGYLRLSTCCGRKRANERGEAMLHRIVWVEHHGAIPPGHQVMFRDGDRRNCAIDNLFCKSRREASLGRKSGNAWTKFYKGLGPRPVVSLADKERRLASLRRAWANYTPEQKHHRLRGIHRRWRERQEKIAA